MKYDLAIIGGGPGGYVAAIRASQLKLKVVVIEKEKLGGVCLNWGCIPTKALLKNAEILHAIQNASIYGINIDSYKVDWKKVIKRSRDVSNQLNKGIHYLFKKNGIKHINGKGTLLDNNTIQIISSNENISIKANNIIISTGSRAKSFPGLRYNGINIISYREAMVLSKRPDSIAIIGAGAIGVEFADFFNTFGTKVILIESSDYVLPNEDKEISVELERLLLNKGIEVKCKESVVNINEDDNKTVIKLKSGKSIQSDLVLVAIGVKPNVENIGLKKLNINFSNDGINTNKHMQTNVESIYAIGDVAGPPMLAHKASAEGIIAVESIAGKETKSINYRNIPSCVYCSPQIASIGMTEKEAIERGISIKIGKFPLKALGMAMATRSTDGFVKIIYDEKYGELIGCHIIGKDATNLITEIGVARNLETTWNEIISTIHPHPTMSEAIIEATADALGEAIHF